MRPVSILKVVLIVALAVTLAVSVAAAATRNVGVKHKGNKWSFTPSTLTIKKGSTVKWKWSGKTFHNVTSSGFHSKTSAKLTFSHKFTKAGTYKVECTIHQSLGQKMTIKVK